MKTSYHITSILLFVFVLMQNIFAQAPKLIPMQGVLRDSSSNPLVGTFNVRFSILDSIANGPQLWQEIHSVTTNNLGLFTTELGNVDPVDIIFWSHNAKFMKLELDTGNNNYIHLGTTQMLSVPYALYADSSASSADNRWAFVVISNGVSQSQTVNIYNVNNGNVGIGTTTPGSKLSVKGNMSIGDSIANRTGPPNGLSIQGVTTIGDTGTYLLPSSPSWLHIKNNGKLGKHISGLKYEDIADSSTESTGFEIHLANVVRGDGCETNIDGLDMVTGHRMNLKGNSDSTSITGNHIIGNGSGKEFIGTFVSFLDADGDGLPDSWEISNMVGSRMQLAARDSIIGIETKLIGESDSTIIYGTKVTATGSGKRLIAYGAASDPGTGNPVYTWSYAAGADINIGATDSVIGSNMNLNGGSDSAIVIGNSLTASHGKKFTGFSVNAAYLDAIADRFMWSLGTEMNIGARDSVIGSDITLHNGSDSTKMIGLRIKAGPNAAGGDLSKSWCVGLKVIDNEGRKNSTGMEMGLKAGNLLTGQKITLTGITDSTKVTGMRVIPQGIGKTFRGFSTGFLPEIEDETIVMFANFNKAIGSELMVNAIDSVIGTEIIVDNGNDSTKVMGLRIKAGPNAAAGDSSTKNWCFKVLTTDNAWKKTTGTDLVLGAPQSVTGHRLMLAGTSDSAKISGVTVIPQGIGDRFVAFRNDPYAEDSFRDLPVYKTAIGSDFHLSARDTIKGSAYYINSSDVNAPCDAIVNYSVVKTSGNGWAMDSRIEAADTAGGIKTTFSGTESMSRLFGYTMQMNGPAKSANGIIINAKGNLWSVGSRIDGCEINITNTNADSARGLIVKNSGQNLNFGGDFDVSGGINNIGLRSTVNGNGAAGIFSGNGGAAGLLVSNGNVGIGTTLPTVLLDVNGSTRLRSLTTSGLVMTDAAGNLSSVAAIGSNEISDNSINSSDIFDGSIMNADVSPAAAIAYSKLNLSGSIINGDIANNAIDLSAKVANILPPANGGTGISSPPSTSGQYLRSSGANTWAVSNIQAIDLPLLSGDVSGNIGSNTVTAIRNVVVSGAAPVNGNVLKYNSATLQWEPTASTPRVAFEAGVQPPTSIPNNVNTVVIYGTPTFNDANAYNPATGIFTAPAAGTYHFDASVMWQAVTAGPQYQMRLEVNGVVKKGTYNTFSFAQDFNQSVSIDLSLNAGDQVKVTVFHSSAVAKNILGGLTFCTFSGHQLY
jgi:hypothetical protein